MRVLERENRKAPNQHRTFSSCRRKRATPPLPLSRLRSPTSTPKPRAEGSSPSAPAKNSATAFAVALFFVMAVGETEARGACRASPPKRRLWRMQRGGDGAAVGDWQGGPAAADRAGHRKRACEASSSPSLHFRYVMGESPSLSLLYSGLSHPASSVPNRPIPSRAQNAPGFALFGLFRVGFAFCPLSAPKSSGMILWLGWRPLSLSSTKKAGIVPGLFPTDSSHAVLPV